MRDISRLSIGELKALDVGLLALLEAGRALKAAGLSPRFDVTPGQQVRILTGIEVPASLAIHEPAPPVLLPEVVAEAPAAVIPDAAGAPESVEAVVVMDFRPVPMAADRLRTVLIEVYGTQALANEATGGMVSALDTAVRAGAEQQRTAAATSDILAGTVGIVGDIKAALDGAAESAGRVAGVDIAGNIGAALGPAAALAARLWDAANAAVAAANARREASLNYGKLQNEYGSGPDAARSTVWHLNAPTPPTPGTGAAGPSTDTFTIDAPGGGTSGTCNIEVIVGGATGFVASAAGQVAHRLGIDLVCPQGLYSLSDDGDLQHVSVQVVADVRPIDDSGAPTGGWVNALNTTISAKTATPVRRSFQLTLPGPGRYQVRARRATPTAPANTFNQVLWGGLRAYLAEEQDFGNVTVIAVKMRATNNLSLQASRRINVTSTRKLPVWNGTSWSAPVPTRSIAWAIADAWRNADYSVGRPDRKCDLAALLELDAVWAARGDTFNFRFDQAGTWWDAVQTIAAAGRARCYMQGGILRVARDRPQSVPVMLFGQRNIIRGTFNLEWLMPPGHRSTALDVHYFDAETWAPESVRVDLFDSGSAPPVRAELRGVDNRPQVTREGAYMAAANRYRRRMITFETEMEGFSPAPLELIAIQHDMPGWGRQAEVTAWRAADRVLTLTEPVAVTAQTVIGLRRPNGSYWGPVSVTQGATETEVVLAEAPDFTPVTGQDRVRTHVAIGTSNVAYMPALFLRAVPRGLNRVLVEAVSEDPAVHTAELGITPPPRRASLLPRRITRPEVRDLFARPVPGDATRAVLGWRPAPGADVYRVEMAEGFDPNDPDAVWTPVAEISSASISLPLLHPRRTMVRVQGIGLAAGPWTAATLGSLIGSFWVGAATDPFWIGTGTDPFWRNL